MDSVIGVTEKRGSYQDALRRIGQQDPDGQTIGIVYVESGVFSFFPTFFRALGLVFVLSVYFLHQPLGFLPEGVHWTVDALHGWEVVSLGTWLTAVVLYLLYFGFSLVKNNLYTGQPGAEIHFMKHEKIVKTLRPGEWSFVLDPRVQPYAVVSSKLIVLEMPEIDGNTSENITQKYRGAIRMRVTDTYRLLERGGFEKFLRQLREVYESIIKDAVLKISAREFNQFMVESVAVPEIEGESVTERLDNLESSDLSVEYLTGASQIEEIDISQFDLEESDDPDRRQILDRLQRLGSDYGIDIIDHIPVGNLTSGDYLRTLALPLVSSITRLRQATETLREITEEEIDEEIQAKVAELKLAVRETDQVLREIKSMRQTLNDEENKEAIMQAREATIENAAQEEIAPAISLIESLQAQIRAKEMSTIGAIERFNSEWEQILDELETKLPEYVPQVESVVVNGVNEDIIPGEDVVQRVLEDTGTLRQLERLVEEAGDSYTEAEIEEIIQEIEGKAEDVNVSEIMDRLQTALDQISSESEISTERFSLDNVESRLEEISEDVDASLQEG
ncbi:hypothetical protein GGP72_001142 [Salinibacter ruber]|uniref:Band 7 domain-containing protein n=1 Tax=Salinibacter ruber TaxID=146919 RepID=A0A9X2PUV4_9BACT|nr:hypothetical protein [Salinibacter ruber]MCS3677225.1 hypothetical protein [Salinibacter ruber]MCS3680513.1 hypothetical protein [Salinibacter ruber]